MSRRSSAAKSAAFSISYSSGAEQTGKSVCDSIEALAAYLAASGVPFDAGYQLVVLDGYDADDTDEDAHLGARLIHPTTIIAVEPITARLLDLIDAAYAA